MASQDPQISGSIDVVVDGNVLPGRDLLALADENIKTTVNEHNRLKQPYYTRYTRETHIILRGSAEMLGPMWVYKGWWHSPESQECIFYASLWMQSASSVRTLRLLWSWDLLLPLNPGPGSHGVWVLSKLLAAFSLTLLILWFIQFCIPTYKRKKKIVMFISLKVWVRAESYHHISSDVRTCMENITLFSVNWKFTALFWGL